MTEKRVIIDLDREATPDQMVTMQDGIEDSIDHIVFDTLVNDRGYSGLNVSVNGTKITVGVGRYYAAGKVYAFDTPLEIDVLGKLPQATKRMVLITAYSTEGETDKEQVNFLDAAASTPQAPVYKPQAVATTYSRLAVVQPAYGDEAPNPPTPGYGLALPVAQLLLTPAGITIQAGGYNLSDGLVPNLQAVEARVDALEVFEAKVGPQVSSLASDLATLANQLKSSASQGVIGRILLRIASLDSKVGIPSNAADSSADYLLDGTNTDLTHPLSNCKVQEGIRFADDNAATTVLNLFNPFETAAAIKGGVLFPMYDRYLRRTTGPKTGTVQANSYTYNPVSYTQKTETRTRTRFGTQFQVCTNSAFWNSGSYDPITSIFTLYSTGETFKAAFDLNGLPYIYSADGYAHIPIRLQQFWTDTVSDTYWDAVVQAPQSLAGYHMAESELIGQDQWVDAVGFYLDKVDSQGPVTVLVCEAGKNAAPKPTAVLAQVTVPYAQLVAGENIAALPTPVLITAGKRISYVVVTAGAHALQTTDGANFPQGTFFVLAPSGYAQGDLTKHLRLNIYGCKFRQATTTIQLQNLQLAGGITSIDILAGTIAAASVSVQYSIQVAGVLLPLSAASVGLLNAGGSLPPNLPLYVTFTGTPDMQGAVNLAKSTVTVSRPKTVLAHVWPKNPRTPPVPSANIRAIVRYESYDAAQHSWGAKLLTGASRPYLTQTAPNSFSDVVYADGSVERTYVWNLGAAVSAYQLLTTSTATTPFKVGLGAWIKDFVL